MNTNNPTRLSKGFTLIEILVVIAIMGIIAAMVLTGGQYASKVKKETAVKAELEKLKTMIDNYQAKLNYYPPDNGNLATLANTPANVTLYENYTAMNPLLYELTGGTNMGNSAIVFNNNMLLLNGGGSYNSFFNRAAIANSDVSEPQNFFKPPPMPKDYTNYTSGGTVFGLVVPVPLKPGQNNFWHYDASSPFRHNQNGYDLWAEFAVSTMHGGLVIETNGNW